ncbi:hypothetical protein BDV93DRAFT_514300 [Ceratobasidium sp. AG-I]|nr:hypothetical protein BDV93DRAFT_514300 [Ceratobasidium sp. AG-I]
MAAETGKHVEEIYATSCAAHRVPTELILHIIDLAANTVANRMPLESHPAYRVVPAKPDFAALKGLSGSCRMYHTSVQKAWYRILYMGTLDDWEMVDRLGIPIYVRQVHPFANTELRSTEKFESSQTL